MRRPTSLKFQMSRKVKACCWLAVIVWLVVSLALPPYPGRIVGITGLLILIPLYLHWARGDEPQPKWGCFLMYRQMEIEFEIDRNLAKLESLLDARQPQHTLLRVAESRNNSGDELLRPAAGPGSPTPAHLLRATEDKTHT